MAYMNQERKAKLAPAIKEICKRYGVKATISVNNHMTLRVNIKSGKLDLIGNYNKVAGNRYQNDPMRFRAAIGYLDVNPYWYRDHFDGTELNFLTELLVAMNQGNHDNSDIMTDYFDVGWYVDVNVGQWNKPYVWETE